MVKRLQRKILCRKETDPADLPVRRSAKREGGSDLPVRRSAKREGGSDLPDPANLPSVP